MGSLCKHLWQEIVRRVVTMRNLVMWALHNVCRVSQVCFHCVSFSRNSNIICYNLCYEWGYSSVPYLCHKHSTKPTHGFTKCCKTYLVARITAMRLHVLLQKMYNVVYLIMGLYPLSRRNFYSQISRSLETGRFGLRRFIRSEILQRPRQQRSPSNFRATRSLQVQYIGFNQSISVNAHKANYLFIGIRVSLFTS